MSPRGRGPRARSRRRAGRPCAAHDERSLEGAAGGVRLSEGELEWPRRTSTDSPRASPIAAKCAAASSSSRPARSGCSQPRDRRLVGEHVPDGGLAGDLKERLQRLLEDDPQPQRGTRRPGGARRCSAARGSVQRRPPSGTRAGRRSAPRHPPDRPSASGPRRASRATGPAQRRTPPRARAPARARSLPPPPGRRPGRPRIGESLQGAPLRPRVVELVRDREALLDVGRTAGERAGAVVDRRIASSASARSSVRPGAAASDASSRCVTPRGRSAASRTATARCSSAAARLVRAPVVRDAEVGRLGVQARVLALPLGERERPSAWLLARLGALRPPRAVRRRTAAPSRAAGSAAPARRSPRRAISRPAAPARRRPRARAPHPRTRSRRRRGRSRRRTRRGGAATSARRRRAVVAPFERRQQRLLARGAGASRPQQPEAVIQTVGERAAPEAAEARRRELDRERQAVETEADARHVASVLLVQREAGGGRRRPLGEQRDRLVAEQLLALSSLRARNRHRGNAEDDLAGTRRGSRLVVRIAAPARRTSSASQSAAAAGRTCSQLSSTSSSDARREVVDHGLAWARPDSGRYRARPRRPPRPARLRRSPARRTRRRPGSPPPSAVRARARAGSFRAARARERQHPRVAGERFSSRSSCSRPMKELVGSGSLRAAPRPADPRALLQFLVQPSSSSRRSTQSS